MRIDPGRSPKLWYRHLESDESVWAKREEKIEKLSVLREEGCEKAAERKKPSKEQVMVNDLKVE